MGLIANNIVIAQAVFDNPPSPETSLDMSEVVLHTEPEATVSEEPVVPPVVEMPHNYDQHHYLVAEGKVKHISRASSYLLDMMTKDEA